MARIDQNIITSTFPIIILIQVLNTIIIIIYNLLSYHFIILNFIKIKQSCTHIV